MALCRSHFQCGKCEGRRSQSSAARTPSLALPPRWARKEFCVVVCTALLTFVCMLRYWMWNVVPIWFWDSSVLMVVRCDDLVSGFFDIYDGTLWRSAIWFWDSSVLIVVCCADLVLDSSIFMMVRCADLVPVFWILWCFFDVCFFPMLWLFSCRLEASARGRWHRAGLLRRRGDYYLGCGRRRYCGRVCCLSRRRVLALPQCF